MPLVGLAERSASWLPWPRSEQFAVVRRGKHCAKSRSRRVCNGFMTGGQTGRRPPLPARTSPCINAVRSCLEKSGLEHCSTTPGLWVCFCCVARNQRLVASCSPTRARASITAAGMTAATYSAPVGCCADVTVAYSLAIGPAATGTVCTRVCWRHICHGPGAPGPDACRAAGPSALADHDPLSQARHASRANVPAATDSELCEQPPALLPGMNGGVMRGCPRPEDPTQGNRICRSEPVCRISREQGWARGRPPCARGVSRGGKWSCWGGTGDESA